MTDPSKEGIRVTDTTAEHPTDDTPDDTADEQPDPGNGAAAPRQVSIPLATLVRGGAIGVLVVAVAVLGWLYWGARGDLDAQQRRSADDAHAQQVALDYAANAARMDYRDLTAWKSRLVAGTSPELRAKLSEAADSMEQILTPLQWESSAKPLAAVVRSRTGDSYVVDAFVSVLTKTTQAPDGLQSTATYSVTLDRGHDWQITDVGGVDAVLGTR